MIPYRSIHFVGILTPFMASLALFCVRAGVKVSGSDDHENSLVTPYLEKEGVTCYGMFAQLNVTQHVELVVLSPFYDTKHVEAINAVQLKIPVMSATDFAREITGQMKRIVALDSYEGPLVATYLTHILRQGHFSTNAVTNTLPLDRDISLSSPQESDWLVMSLSGFKRDASTYEAAFLSFEAEMVILPTIRYDYPELNTTLDDVYDSYYRFVKKVPRRGLIIGNSDFTRMKRLRGHLADRHIETYGHDSDAMWRIRDKEETDTQTTFSLLYQNQLYGPITAPVVTPLAVNAVAAAFVMAMHLDMRPDVIIRGIASLPPLCRYFETKIDKQGRIIIDDQADHPDTIRSVLETVKRIYPNKKVWCLYQPGSYLRTKAMFNDLGDALSLADNVYIADIKGYPKEKSEGLHIRHFIAEMKRVHTQTYYIEDPQSTTSLLDDRVARNDCIVVLGQEGLCQQIVNALLEVGKRENA